MIKNLFFAIAALLLLFYYLYHLIVKVNRNLSTQKVPKEIADQMRSGFRNQIKPLIAKYLDSDSFKFPVAALFRLGELGNNSDASYILTYFILLDDHIIDVANFNIKKSYNNKLYLAFQTADKDKNPFGDIMIIDKDGALIKINSLFNQLQKAYFADVKSKIDRLKPDEGNTQFIINKMSDLNNHIKLIENSRFFPKKVEFELTESVSLKSMEAQDDQLTLFTNVDTVFSMRINELSDYDFNCLYPPGCSD